MSSPALQFLIFTVARWLGRHQLRMIEHLLEENRILRHQLGGRRLRLKDAQRCRLALRGKAIGRKELTEVAYIVTPDTSSSPAVASTIISVCAESTKQSVPMNWMVCGLDVVRFHWRTSSCSARISVGDDINCVMA